MLNQNIEKLKLPRESNFELIRIVAMSTILIGHFFYRTIGINKPVPEAYYWICPFFAYGVNLFFLLSGWFTIKFSCKKIVSFVILILLFDLLNYFACVGAGETFSIKKLLLNFIWPITDCPYWFMKVYLFLMMVGPLIMVRTQDNSVGGGCITINKLRVIVLVLTIAVAYSCCLGGNLVNTNGQTFFQGLYIYIIGSYLREDRHAIDKIKSCYLIVGCIALLCLSGFFLSLTPKLAVCGYMARNNSIFIILSAMMLFIVMSRIKIRNRVINLLGGVSLACYLLQEGTFGNKYFYDWCYDIYRVSDLGHMMVFFAIIFICYWFAAIIVSPIFKMIANSVTLGFFKLLGVGRLLKRLNCD